MSLKSKKQTIVSRNNVGPDLRAMAQVLLEGIWMGKLLKEISNRSNGFNLSEHMEIDRIRGKDRRRLEAVIYPYSETDCRYLHKSFVKIKFPKFEIQDRSVNIF